MTHIPSDDLRAIRAMFDVVWTPGRDAQSLLNPIGRETRQTFDEATRARVTTKRRLLEDEEEVMEL